MVGVQPWLPRPLAGWPWWTEPVRAERLAGLRIGVGLTLILDVFVTYWPRARDFYGAGSLADAGIHTDLIHWTTSPFRLLAGFESSGSWQILLLLTACAGLLLMVGCATRLAAGAAWFLASSLHVQNVYLHAGADNVRDILLFLLIFAPSGADWSVDAWLQRRLGKRPPGVVWIHPWALRLFFIQLAVIYGFSGAFKLNYEVWLKGHALHYVLGSTNWMRSPYFSPALPLWLIQASSWFVMLWEFLFPLMVFRPLSRRIALGLGVFFHVGTCVSMRLGFFPLYMLCMYLPFVPWERVADRFSRRRTDSSSSLR